MRMTLAKEDADMNKTKRFFKMKDSKDSKVHVLDAIATSSLEGAELEMLLSDDTWQDE